MDHREHVIPVQIRRWKKTTLCLNKWLSYCRQTALQSGLVIIIIILFVHKRVS